MQFDFEQFTKRFKRAYPVARYGRRKQNDGNDCDLFSYDEALEVFREYFLAYEYYTGTAHPQLKREKIIDIIQRMDVGETPETCPYDDMSFSPADYPAMIDAHFRTKYCDDCDYNICHFFSGCIRYLRWFNTAVVDRELT